MTELNIERERREFLALRPNDGTIPGGQLQLQFEGWLLAKRAAQGSAEPVANCKRCLGEGALYFGNDMERCPDCDGDGFTAPPAPVSAEPAAISPRLRTIINFLLGEGPLDGKWYGDIEGFQSAKRFWWRRELRDIASAPPSADAKDSGLTKDEIAKIAGGCMQTSTYNLFMQFVSGAIAAKEAGK